MGLDGIRLRKHLATLEVVALDTAQQDAHVVASDTLVQGFLEHFNAGHNHLFGVFAQADDFNFIAHLHDATVNTTGAHGTTTLDGEHIFDAHQEVEVFLALRQRDVAVQGIHQIVDALAGSVVLAFGLHHGQRVAADDGHFIAGEAVLREKFADFHLHQLEQLAAGIVGHGHVDLVQVHHDLGYTDLAGQQDVLAGLGHHARVGGHH